MNITLWLYLLIPVVAGVILFLCFQKHPMGWMLLPALTLPGLAVVGITFVLAYGDAVLDTEIWNGAITGKERQQGTYEQPYDCNCRTVTSGSGKDQTTSRQCDTCYETHYTVHWDADSTLGSYRIAALDSTSRSVYLAPDPQRWSIIQAGDPASKTHPYVNYVQAVPNSLFATISTANMAQYNKWMLPYPSVYDFYRCDHFMSAGVYVPDHALWSQDTANMLRQLGPAKQVNAIVVLMNTNDPQAADALRQHWNGLKKNDVALIIGSSDSQKIDWVRVISWTKNEAFKLELRQDIEAIGTLDRTKIIPALQAQITKNFERRHMKEFEYLKGEIDPPAWLLETLFGILFVGYALVGYALYRTMPKSSSIRSTLNRKYSL